MTLSPRTRLGSYEIVAPLGAGGHAFARSESTASYGGAAMVPDARTSC
jgi:hypothetical protein